MRFDIGRWRAREWLVLGCATLVLLVSLSDWYGISVRDAADPRSSWEDLAAANAWQASTAWTLAVGVGVFAAVLWLAHRGQAVQPRWPRRVAAGLVLAALGAIGWQVLAMDDAFGPDAPTTSVAVSRVGPAGFPYTEYSSLPVDSASARGGMTAYASTLSYTQDVDPVDRDDLVVGRRDGYRAGARWGTAAGAVLLAVILLMLLTTPVTGATTLATPGGPPLSAGDVSPPAAGPQAGDASPPTAGSQAGDVAPPPAGDGAPPAEGPPATGGSTPDDGPPPA